MGIVMEVNNMAMIALICGGNKPTQTLVEHLISHNNKELDEKVVRIDIPGDNISGCQIQSMVRHLASYPPEIEFVEIPPYPLITKDTMTHDVLRHHCDELRKLSESIGGNDRK